MNVLYARKSMYHSDGISPRTANVSDPSAVCQEHLITKLQGPRKARIGVI